MATCPLPDDATLDQVNDLFRNDRYANETLRPRIEEASHGHSRVSMDIEPHHLNAMGSLMGGVPFVLADFSFAIASNIGQAPTVSISSTIDHVGVPRTNRLIATCDLDKDGRSLCFATVVVNDDAGNPVARVHFKGFRKH
ncbi:PaaI family thioesterase [Eggerthellaceae bacterium zg-893]|nr:PaaI family thioesterase [Eggerthellaceae bacterium zg-893]